MDLKKIQTSPLFSDEIPFEQKDAICKSINDKMEFDNLGLSLNPDNVKPETCARSFEKLALNSILGKFSQRNDLPFHKIVSSPKEINQYFYNKTHRITNIFAINSTFCQLQIEHKKTFTET